MWRTHLSERCFRPFDGDTTLIVDGCPDADRFARHVAASVEPHTARHGTRREAVQAEPVLDLAVERLLLVHGNRKRK